MGLKRYWEKRDFQKTAEPRGREHEKRGFSFTIQRHHASHLHYDFRLELDGVLKSWAVPKGPCLDPSVKRLAVEVEDHPVEYGDFEGTIPKGQYGGGTVVLWDRGHWEPEGDPHAGLKKGHLRFSLHGHKLEGRWDLVRTHTTAAKPQWLLFKADDEHARPLSSYDVTEARPESVASPSARRARKVWQSNRAPSKTARPKKRRPVRSVRFKTPLPSFEPPQLATLVDQAPAGDAWLHEVKFDGYRILAYVENGNVRLYTRKGNDWTAQLSPIAAALVDLPAGQAILDGEAVVLDEKGVSSFQALQNLLSQAGRGRLVYYAFDLLWLDGEDLRPQPLETRKERLAALLQSPPSGVRYSEHVRGNGPEFLAQACAHGLEGIICKRADAAYASARTKDWLKAKCLRRQEFVVCGFTDPSGARSRFGALVLGVREKGGLRYVGRVGTGFHEKALRDLHDRLVPLEREDAPVDNPPTGAAAKGVHWVEPKLVAEVAFGEWTDEGILRHPRYVGLREDKAPVEVRRETPAVTLTHPNRVLYPESGVTKADLARYYEAVAERALPHLARRALTLVRCPMGRGKQCFYQKHLGEDAPPQLHGVKIAEGGTPRMYVYIEDEEGLSALVQRGVLEIHPWGSRVDALETPDVMTFDLDPAPEIRFDRLLAATREVRDRLTDLGLTSFLKTTGGKGFHVVVPLQPRADWDRVKAWSKAFVEAMVKDEPHNYTSKITKSSRTGKIFVDYLRNGRGATAVGAYSTRARPKAPVATPLSWDELTPKLDMSRFTVRTVPARLRSQRSDPWKGFFDVRQSLK